MLDLACRPSMAKHQSRTHQCQDRWHDNVFCYCDCCHDGSVRDLTLVVVVKWVLLDSL